MSNLTVDASTVIAWLMPSQRTPSAAALELALDRYSLRAPFIFPWEVRNVLIRQSKRIRSYPLKATLLQLERYEIDIGDPDELDIDALTEIAAAGKVSLFDVAYFWSAANSGSTVASRDAGLLALCRTHGVDVMDLRG